MIVRASCYGCVPNKNRPEAVAGILSRAVPWDGGDVPPVVSWKSFSEQLEQKPDIEADWWTGIDLEKHFTASQSYRPNCAGFAKANASECALLLQRKYRYSEQKVEKINPMVCWQLSKGGSVSGGQSIAEMASAGNQYGNFLVSDVGEYDPAVVFNRTEKKADDNALAHQDSICLYDGNDPASAILLICRKGYSCFVGNSNAVAGVKIDENGVRVAVLGGYWSHAGAFAGFKIVNGKLYVFWLNSHGNIYNVERGGIGITYVEDSAAGNPKVPVDCFDMVASYDGTPAFGAWMDEQTLRRFMSSSFNDLCAIPYTEAPYDETITPTLNPEAV